MKSYVKDLTGFDETGYSMKRVAMYYMLTVADKTPCFSETNVFNSTSNTYLLAPLVSSNSNHVINIFTVKNA